MTAPATPFPSTDDVDLVALADTFKLLGDPTRLAVLAFAATTEHPFGAITARLGVNQPALSHHLAVLRHAKLVTHRRDGKYVLYRASPEVATLIAAAVEAAPAGPADARPAGGDATRTGSL